MKKHDANHTGRGPSPETGASPSRGRVLDRVMFLPLGVRIGIGALVLAGAIVAGVAIGGCGGRSVESSPISSSTSTPTVEAVTAEQHGLPATHAQSASTGSLPESLRAGVRESMPPEVEVTPSSTEVAPGDVVEITAHATGDVTEMSLWDGRGQREPFALDPTQQVWRVKYRVPLRTPDERVSLSVTAKNADERWRRVWVFLNVPQQAKADVP